MGEFSLTYTMSDEFLQLATKEINEEISLIEDICNSSNDNREILSNANKIQSHTHKIKGLSPMMGKEDLGEIASLLDSIFKKIIDGAEIDVYDVMLDSVSEMKNSMSSPNYDLGEIKKRILKISFTSSS